MSLHGTLLFLLDVERTQGEVIVEAVNTEEATAMQVLAISGSLRKNSTNAALLRAFARHALKDCVIELYEELGSLPAFDPDLEDRTPQVVLDFAARIRTCDAIMIASPEYAHGIPGVLKNGLDWLVSRQEIPGMPVMLVHASTRSTISREHLREVLRTMSCVVHAGPEFEFHLVGKQPEEVERLLNGATPRARLREALRELKSLVATANLRRDVTPQSDQSS